MKFQADRGAPEKTRLNKLIPWNQHSDDGIKYFSGTATNTIKFNVPKSFLKKNTQVWLDLGDVGVMCSL